jgi:putative transposase
MIVSGNYLRLPVHFVWATWDRLPLITEAHERRLHRQITVISEECRCKVLAVGGMPDHVHVLLAMPSTITVGDLMKRIKGGSSRFMSETLTPGEWFAWQGSYGATAVCETARQRTIDYIANQKQHHADGTLWPNAEKTQDDENDSE